MVRVQAHGLEQLHHARIELGAAGFRRLWMISASPMIAPTVMRGLSEA
jgi:hypothetical protein